MHDEHGSSLFHPSIGRPQRKLEKMVYDKSARRGTAPDVSTFLLPGTRPKTQRLAGGCRNLSGFGAFSRSHQRTRSRSRSLGSVAYPPQLRNHVLGSPTVQLDYMIIVPSRCRQSSVVSRLFWDEGSAQYESLPRPWHVCDGPEHAPCNLSQTLSTKTGDSAVQSQNRRTVRHLPWKTLRRRNFPSILPRRQWL